MTSATQNQIDRLRREIVDLQRLQAREIKKEADLRGKLNRIAEAISRASSSSTITSKLKEQERALRDLSVVQNKHADISRKIAEKSKNLHSYESRKTQEDEKERKKIANEQKRLIREQEKYEQRVAGQVKRHASTFLLASGAHLGDTNNYDFFISHASEDKDGFVRGLAEALQARGARVWYDEFALRVGDSLREKIDQGLANSRFGVVVLSKHFFSKEWPQKELNGLFSREVEGVARILPIWHEISKDEVASYSPMLADKVALNTSLKSTDEIATELYDMLG